MSDKKFVVFDFTGALYKHTEILTVGYQYPDDLADEVAAAEAMLGWDEPLRCVHFGRDAMLAVRINSDGHWETNWGTLIPELHRFQTALSAVGIASVKVYETAEFPPRYWCRDEGDTNPLAPTTT